VAVVNFRSARAQLADLFIHDQIGPGDKETKVQQQVPEPAHAASAGPNQECRRSRGRAL
jgi:D-alanyl-D-alanine dipeptidase